MSLSKVTITKSTNNLGRVRQGDDQISGLLSFGSIPSGFGSANTMLVGSVAQAEGFGITSTSYAVLHYHISEFFRVAGNSSLYVGIFNHAGSNAYDFSEVLQMQRDANGAIRQLGVYLTDDLSTGLVNLLQTQKIALDALQTPLSVLLTANIVGVSLPDFSTANSYGVSIITDQSASGVGATLFGTTSKTIGALGACLGAISLSPVQQSIGAVEFVEVAGNELDVIQTGAGVLYTSQTDANRDAESSLGYIKLVKHAGLSGTFFNDDITCGGSSDLNTIHLNRVIDKASRGIASALAKKINANIQLNADGTITALSAKAFESLAGSPLDIMKSASELSDYSVFINPSQNILQTDNLNVEVDLLPIGVAKTITVNIGFTASL